MPCFIPFFRSDESGSGLGFQQQSPTLVRGPPSVGAKGSVVPHSTRPKIIHNRNLEPVPISGDGEALYRSFSISKFAAQTIARPSFPGGHRCRREGARRQERGPEERGDEENITLCDLFHPSSCNIRTSGVCTSRGRGYGLDSSGLYSEKFHVSESPGRPSCDYASLAKCSFLRTFAYL